MSILILPKQLGHPTRPTTAVSANERAVKLKLTAFNRKRHQLEALGVNTLVTVCANCRITLEEGLEFNNMDVAVLGLAETLAEHLEERISPSTDIPMR